jgi:hypothetical protein
MHLFGNKHGKSVMETPKKMGKREKGKKKGGSNNGKGKKGQPRG